MDCSREPLVVLELVATVDAAFRRPLLPRPEVEFSAEVLTMLLATTAVALVTEVVM